MEPTSIWSSDISAPTVQVALQRRLLTSGAIVLGQFIGFLFIGVLLFAFYQPFADPGYATAASTAFPFTGGDRVFPDFITRHMPPGLSGLVVAAIFAAAMSSSLNSIAATAMNDLYKPLRAGRSDQHYLKVSHVLTLLWGVVQIARSVGAKEPEPLRAGLGVVYCVIDQWPHPWSFSGRRIS